MSCFVQPDVGMKGVRGSMDRVRHAGVNLDLLTSPAMVDMEAKYQVKVNLMLC